MSIGYSVSCMLHSCIGLLWPRRSLVEACFRIASASMRKKLRRVCVASVRTVDSIVLPITP